MKVGAWDVNVTVGAMPQKVATAFGELNLVGAEYTPIAYLGSQVVNGTNHAVLAEQLVLSGKDTKNVVLMIFNEKGMNCDLVNIERVLESGGPLGGTTVDVNIEIPEEAKKAWENVFENFVGSGVNPFVYLGSQLTNGMSYFFAAEVVPVVKDPEKKVAIVTVNCKDVVFSELLEGKNSLGYSFTWLKGMSLGVPLGEWP